MFRLPGFQAEGGGCRETHGPETLEGGLGVATRALENTRSHLVTPLHATQPSLCTDIECSPTDLQSMAVAGTTILGLPEHLDTRRPGTDGTGSRLSIWAQNTRGGVGRGLETSRSHLVTP